jgi:hypothetical protein
MANSSEKGSDESLVSYLNNSDEWEVYTKADRFGGLFCRFDDLSIMKEGIHILNDLESGITRVYWNLDYCSDKLSVTYLGDNNDPEKPFNFEQGCVNGVRFRISGKLSLRVSGRLNTEGVGIVLEEHYSEVEIIDRLKSQGSGVPLFADLNSSYTSDFYKNRETDGAELPVHSQ